MNTATDAKLNTDSDSNPDDRRRGMKLVLCGSPSARKFTISVSNKVFGSSIPDLAGDISPADPNNREDEALEVKGRSTRLGMLIGAITVVGAVAVAYLLVRRSDR